MSARRKAGEARLDVLELGAERARRRAARTISDLGAKASVANAAISLAGLLLRRSGGLRRRALETVKADPAPWLVAGFGLAWAAASALGSNHAGAREAPNRSEADDRAEVSEEDALLGPVAAGLAGLVAGALVGALAPRRD